MGRLSPKVTQPTDDATTISFLCLVMSLSAARERSRQEMKSFIDRANVVFFACSLDIYRLCVTLSKL